MRCSTATRGRTIRSMLCRYERIPASPCNRARNAVSVGLRGARPCSRWRIELVNRPSLARSAGSVGPALRQTSCAPAAPGQATFRFPLTSGLLPASTISSIHSPLLNDVMACANASVPVPRTLATGLFCPGANRKAWP